MASIGGSLDVAGLVSQLVAVERAPAARWNTMRLAALAQQTAWSDIGSKFSAVRTAAEALDSAREIATSAATSSDDKVLTATAGNGALVAKTTVKVTQLAAAEQRSDPAHLSAGPSSLVGAGQALVTSYGGTGTTGLTVGSGLAAGRHTVTVSAPKPAVLTGTTAPTFPLTVSDVSIGGTAVSGTFASMDALTAALREQVGSSVDVSTSGGNLRLTSRATGTAATVEVSGSGAAALGLTTTSATGRGFTASLDGGDAVDVVGDGFTFTGKDGTELARLKMGPAGLRAGTVSTNVVRTTASSTMADLTAALNASGSPVSAALVDTGSGEPEPYRFLLTATGSGSKGALSITSDIAALNTLTDEAVDASGDTVRTKAKDAELEVNGLKLTRSSNTLTDVLPDVVLNLATTGTSTVGVTRDQTALTTKAKTLVDGLNTLLSTLATQTKTGVDGAKGGPLATSASARGLSSQLFGASSGAVPTGQTRALSQLGIQVTRDGRYKLDEAALAKAVQDDSDGATGLLASFAGRVAALAKQVGGVDGPVASGGRAAGTDARNRQKQIDALDERLKTVSRRYTEQYSKLNSSMSVLSGQASQLASQIAGMYG